MPSKKKKYNARFPAGRIKKIMQSDEEVGKVAQAVPVIISRTLELFVESLLKKTLKITNARNAKTLSPSHMKQCIMSENRFDFLRELVKNIPDISVADEMMFGQIDEISSPTSIQQSSSSSSPGTSSFLARATSPILASALDNEPLQQPFDLSLNKKTSNGNTKSTPTVVTTIRNGGGISIKISNLSSTKTSSFSSLVSGSSVIHSKSQTAVSLSSTTTTATMRSELKRQWDKSTIPIYSSKNDSDIESFGSSSAKLARMESLPNENQDNNSIKRLYHQSKSVPCSFSLSPSSSPPSSSSSSLLPLSTISKENSLEIALPAIVTTSTVEKMCNKPVVKIDYSNLALQQQQRDNNDSESLTNDSSTCSFSARLNATTNPTENNGDNNLLQTSTTTNVDPVINIDLSNIPVLPLSKTNTSLSSSSLSRIPEIKIEVAKESIKHNVTSSFSSTSTSLSLLNTNSLDLDEDYDNI